MGKLLSVAIDWTSPVDRRTLDVGAEKNGIYKSVDTGDSWTHVTGGLSGAAHHVSCLAVLPAASPTVYAGTGAGLFVTHDAGASWKRLGAGVFEQVEGISICRSRPCALYVCAHYPGQNSYWGKAGFWRSEDSGRSFVDITPPYLGYPGAVAVNPVDPECVYACNGLLDIADPHQKLRILRSRDGGKTWENIGDFINSNRARHLLIDRNDPRKLLVLTPFAIIARRDPEAPTR